MAFVAFAILTFVLGLMSIYMVVWMLEIWDVIEINFVDSFFGAIVQWIETIYKMDVPGIPIRFLDSLLSYYFGEERVNTSKWLQMLFFMFLATPWIYLSTSLFSFFN